MDYKEPRTRTETKKQGKKGGGPYSAKHIRMTAEVMEKRLAEKGPAKEICRGR